MWRVGLFYPERVIGIISVCTAYTPPKQNYVSIEEIVKILPQFQYQVYFNTDEAVKELDDNVELVFKTFFRGTKVKQKNIPSDFIYMKNGPPLLQNLRNEDILLHPMLSQMEYDYYVSEYKRTGFRGGLNFYRTHYHNYEAEKGLSPYLNHKCLMILAEKDAALPPSMADKMSNYIKDLTTVTIKNANHWVLQDYPEEVNTLILNWLKTTLTPQSKM